MAEFFPSILVEGIIEHLDVQTVKKFGFEKLKAIVLELQPVLVLDAEEQQVKNHEIKDWLENLTDILYEVDDLLDDLSAKPLRKELMTSYKKAKQVCIFFPKSNKLVFRDRMSAKFQTILNNLDQIANERKFHLEETRERDHNAFCAEDVIGRDEAKNAVVELLLMDSNVEENVSILPIVAIEGMGKTTLAQLAFNHEKIQEYFQLKMWVELSDDLDVETVIRKMIESAKNEKVEDATPMTTLFEFLEKEIYDKKYLLVLDNVEFKNPGEWFDELKPHIMGCARGSKILVTTRSEEVADITPTVVKPYYLRALNRDDSWDLFKRMAFKNGQDDLPGGLAELISCYGTEIVSECKGVPLTIITIGRLLYSQNLETDFFMSTGDRICIMNRTSEISSLATLKLNYDQLPRHLKQCFAYTCLFPKNSEIDKSTLINLWMAQGFIKSSNGEECLEDAGHECFTYLISRSFFEKVATDWSDEVTSFKMNDLMHDLAMLIAGPSIVTERLNCSGSSEIVIDERTRHVRVDYYTHSLLDSIAKADYCRIRTFLSPSASEPIPGFKTLRALKLGGEPFDISTASAFCKLNSLRYLDLSGMYMMKKLPDSITSLQNLQTLKLCNCSWLEEWPRHFTRLVNLRHLDVSGCLKLTYMPRGLGQLTKLRSLSDFLLPPLYSLYMRHSAGLNELGKLNYLRGDLQIRNLGCGKKDEFGDANLWAKQKIRSLKLYWDDSFGLRYDAHAEIKLEALKPPPNLERLELICYIGTSLPDWLSLLANLVELQLSKCEKLRYLPPLSDLNSLKRLFLKYLEGIEYISDGDDYRYLMFFRSLKELQLYYCPNLKGWWKDQPSFLPSFHCLTELSVSGCTELDSMPRFPLLEKALVLSNSSWKPIQGTIDSSRFDSSSFVPLSKLKCLRLHRMENLHILPLQNLTSLESLQIFHCHGLKSLSQGIQYLTKLQQLEINHCDKLDLGGNDETGMGWQGLQSLLSLDFIGLPNLVHLPSGLQHVSTLQKLQISSCCRLRALPDWIRHWTSLQQFEISNCPSLTSLPKEMCLLKSLKVLTIRKYCPKLLAKCERDYGEDWSKIAHIPELYLDSPSEEKVKNVRKRYNAYHSYPSEVNNSVEKSHATGTAKNTDKKRTPRTLVTINSMNYNVQQEGERRIKKNVRRKGRKGVIWAEAKWLLRNRGVGGGGEGSS